MYMFDLSIVIPCYNESDNINNLYKKLLILKKSKYSIQILLVDNGSNDDTEQKITKLVNQNTLFKYIKIEHNIGYGNGIIQGLNQAEGNYVAWTHADLQTNPLDILVGLEILNDNFPKKVVVKGSRINRPFNDKFFTMLMTMTASIIFGMKLEDVNAQPKIFHRTFLKYLKKAPLDFSLDLFFLIIAKKNQYKVLDFPVYFHSRKAGEAKGGDGSLKNKFKLIFRTLKFIYKLRLSL